MAGRTVTAGAAGAIAGGAGATAGAAGEATVDIESLLS
jgi:hypothetical protein